MADGGDKTSYKAIPPPELRSSPEEVQAHLQAISCDPVITGLLEAVQGLLAVLNEHRQILAVNHLLLSALGVEKDASVLGLRPGEAIRCVHAHDEAAGCGTGDACSTCGAAIAIVAALGGKHSAERLCVLTIERQGKQTDLCFEVRCAPIFVEGRRFLLLFLHDVSVRQQRAALEWAFYHDISNMVEALSANCRLLRDGTEEATSSQFSDQIVELTSRLAKEVRIQKAIARGPGAYELSVRKVSLERLLGNLQAMFANHPLARGKNLAFPPPPSLDLSSDAYLVERILMNMVTNALEAIGEGQEVRLWLDAEKDAVVFGVWNPGSISEAVVPRIFQRNFSTKPGDGRGTGTYTMRLLAESYLQGTVSFETSEAAGTTFRLRLPLAPVPEVARNNP